MTPHIQFLILAAVSLAITALAIIYGWRARLLNRVFATALYIGGYTLIGAAFIVDDILRPPLFVHGFVPGIGIGAVTLALSLILQDALLASGKIAPGPASDALQVSSPGRAQVPNSEDPRQ